ncbi:MAG: asparagine synthase-related protein [Opitutaceae bacterium]
MPSFIFHSNTNEANTGLLIRNGAECIVPKGFEGVRGKVESRNSKLMWHCATHAPVEEYQSSQNGFALLIGEAIADDMDDYLSAERLYNMLTQDVEATAAKLSRYSGFFAWIVVLDDESVHIGSDPFGLFPIYYFHGKSSLSVATSLKALHAHPEYDQSIDPVGFCRHILENGCASHRTVEITGSRLNIAESICYEPKSNRLHVEQHFFPGQNAVKSIHSFDDAIQLSIEATNKAVKRHTRRAVDTCLLSGGLDSRQTLSIAQQLKQRPKCVTLGNRESYESIHARKVARKLNLTWECSGNFSESPQQLLDDELDLFSLGGGFNGLSHSWNHVSALRGTRCLTGLYLDVTYAPFRAAKKEASIGTYEDSKDRCIHHYGINPDELPALLNEKAYSEALDTALNEVRSEWNTFPQDPNERHWHTIARYRARAHHGRLMWKNAFYFWPVSPALDVPLTETIRSINGEFMRLRRLQNETFMAMCPELAAIPFASVNSRPRPLIHTNRNRYYKKLQKLERSGLRIRKKFSSQKSASKDTSDACWKEAKHRALSQLETATDVFNKAKVKKHIDSFYKDDETTQSVDRSVYSQRLLIGSICWLANRQK